MDTENDSRNHFTNNRYPNKTKASDIATERRSLVIDQPPARFKISQVFIY